MRDLLSSAPIESRASRRKPLFGRLVANAIVFGIISALTLASPAWAQGSKDKKEKDVERSEKTISTEDNTDLKLTYYSSRLGKEAPVVVLLHGKGGQRRQWDKFAQDLQKVDFAVVAVDLRGHGESTLPKKSELKKGDYEAMVVQDMEAVKSFIFDEHQLGRLNMNKLGIVACDFTTGVALAAVQVDWSKEPHDDDSDPQNRTPRGQDYCAVAVISPDLSTPGLYAAKVASSLKQANEISFFIACSEKIAADFNSAKKLAEHLATKKDKDERVVVKKYPESVKGMDLVLRDNQLKRDIYDFLVKHVKGHASSWKDRRSRLERE